MCCRREPITLVFLFQSGAGLGAGAKMEGLGRKGPMLLQIQHVGSNLGKLLLVLVPLQPLLLDQLVEISQVSLSLG